MPRVLTKVLLRAIVAAALVMQPAAAQAQRTVLSAGHVDAVAPTLQGEQLSLLVKDDTGSQPVLREPGSVLFHVKPQAHMTVPSGLPPAFEFLGAPGSDIWLLPQVSDPELLWPGWSSETIPAGRFKDDTLVWTLNRVDGPGPVQLFDNGPFGEPRVFFNSADGVPDVERKAVGTHAHFNWVFHAPGVYTFNFSVGGELPDGGMQTLYAEYRFFVGDLADLPPESLHAEGLAAEYDPGESVELTALQLPASRFTDLRWHRRCPADAEPVQVATGPRYVFGASRALDSCRIAVSLHDDAGRELLRSDERLLSVRPGTWGPRTILSRGHTDVLNVRLEDGALRVAVKDDTVEPAVIRRPEDVLLHAKPQSAFTLPEDLPDGFGFLGRPGDTVWMLPEVQQDDILWPGWDTSGVPPGSFAPDELSWRLLSVDGPGALALFTSDSLGQPRVIFNSADGLPDAAAMPVSTHVHANWAFNRTGLYKLRFDLTGTPAGGGPSIASGPVEYWFFVGDLADLPEYPVPDDSEPDENQPPPPAATPTPSPAPPAATPQPQPAPPAKATPKRPSLRLTSVSLRGRTLTLRTRLGTRSRVSVTVHKGKRTVARAKARTVSASRRTLRVLLNRRLSPGRYQVRVTVVANGNRVTRTRSFTFARPRNK